MPRTELTGIQGALAKRLTKRMLGEVPTQGEVMWQNKQVLMTILGMSKKAKRWDGCDEQLKVFAHMAVVALVGCRFCLDLGYFMADHDGLDVEKARQVPRWRESEVFTPLERDVMAYAEAMSQTPPTVTDQLSARLLEQLGAPHHEIAAARGKTPAAVRQIAHRARSHVDARRPRLRVSRAEQTEVVERLLAAIRTGDLDGLLAVLAPEVVAVGDGGGLAPAAVRPLEGPERVAKGLLLVVGSEGVSVEARWVNGALALAIIHRGQLHAVTSVQVDGGLVTGLYGVNNPEKLTRLHRETPLVK